MAVGEEQETEEKRRSLELTSEGGNNLNPTSATTPVGQLKHDKSESCFLLPRKRFDFRLSREELPFSDVSEEDVLFFWNFEIHPVVDAVGKNKDSSGRGSVRYCTPEGMIDESNRNGEEVESVIEGGDELSISESGSATKRSIEGEEKPRGASEENEGGSLDDDCGSLKKDSAESCHLVDHQTEATECVKEGVEQYSRPRIEGEEDVDENLEQNVVDGANVGNDTFREDSAESKHVAKSVDEAKGPEGERIKDRPQKCGISTDDKVGTVAAEVESGEQQSQRREKGATNLEKRGQRAQKLSFSAYNSIALHKYNVFREFFQPVCFQSLYVNREADEIRPPTDEEEGRKRIERRAATDILAGKIGESFDTVSEEGKSPCAEVGESPVVSAKLPLAGHEDCNGELFVEQNSTPGTAVATLDNAIGSLVPLDIREQCFVDFCYNYLKFARESGELSAEKTAVSLSLLATVFQHTHFSAGDQQTLSRAESYNLYTQLMLKHSVARGDGSSVQVFTEGEVRWVTSYVLENFYRCYYLYRAVFEKARLQSEAANLKGGTSYAQKQQRKSSIDKIKVAHPAEAVFQGPEKTSP